MLSVGVDMVEIARVARALERHGSRLNRRLFTEQEQQYCGGQVARLAGRFAVKEAVAKALGTGIGPVSWTEIEVVCDGKGKPELQLHGRAQVVAAAAGLEVWSISLSHTETHAIAFAVATGPAKEEK